MYQRVMQGGSGGNITDIIPNENIISIGKSFEANASTKNITFERLTMGKKYLLDCVFGNFSAGVYPNDITIANVRVDKVIKNNEPFAYNAKPYSIHALTDTPSKRYVAEIYTTSESCVIQAYTANYAFGYATLYEL